MISVKHCYVKNNKIEIRVQNICTITKIISKLQKTIDWSLFPS